ncbi:MAG: NUDIX hydrolase [Lachnospiraceae bacterium]|nr:NUDIX hydrolase [Lachnospiraceae bacterium]
MKKYKDIQSLFQNKYLNFYHMDAMTDSGKTFDYYFASRNSKDSIKAVTGSIKAEGVVIYPIWKEEPDKIVLIRQYRYPVGDMIYELPAGLIDVGEDASQAAIREMQEETGFSLEVYKGGAEYYRRPFYMGAGYTDEACQVVFGYASGVWNRQKLEDTESIRVLLADKQEVSRILTEEKVSLRMAYLMMNFLQADSKDPFAFLSAK